MKITESSGVRPAPLRPGGRRKKVESSGFAEHLELDGTARGVGADAPVGAVDSLLSAQEVANDPAAPKTPTERGEQLLDRLDDIRMGLLSGTIPRHRLEELARLAAEGGGVADAGLAEVLAEIELRAKVELAKHRKLEPPRR